MKMGTGALGAGWKGNSYAAVLLVIALGAPACGDSNSNPDDGLGGQGGAGGSPGSGGAAPGSGGSGGEDANGGSGGGSGGGFEDVEFVGLVFVDNRIGNDVGSSPIEVGAIFGSPDTNVDELESWWNSEFLTIQALQEGHEPGDCIAEITDDNDDYSFTAVDVGSSAIYSGDNAVIDITDCDEELGYCAGYVEGPDEEYVRGRTLTFGVEGAGQLQAQRAVGSFEIPMLAAPMNQACSESTGCTAEIEELPEADVLVYVLSQESGGLYCLGDAATRSIVVSPEFIEDPTFYVSPLVISRETLDLGGAPVRVTTFNRRYDSIQFTTLIGD